jgi:hypothetical protein
MPPVSRVSKLDAGGIQQVSAVVNVEKISCYGGAIMARASPGSARPLLTPTLVHPADTPCVRLDLSQCGIQ